MQINAYHSSHAIHACQKVNLRFNWYNLNRLYKSNNHTSQVNHTSQSGHTSHINHTIQTDYAR